MATGCRVRDDVSLEIIGETPFKTEQRPYVNRLSAREMESLTAVCDTFFPSVHPSTCAAASVTPSQRTFFLTSASDAGIPDRLGGFMSDRLQHVALWMMRLALWFMSTWYGTFVICGWASLSSKLPFFQSFSKVDLRKREQILLSLSCSSFVLYRMLFNGLKFMTSLLYFTQVDEKIKWNPSWKALDYCGPDPDRRHATTTTAPSIIPRQLQQHLELDKAENGRSERQAVMQQRDQGPLSGCLLHLYYWNRNSVSESLHNAGFTTRTTATLAPTIETTSQRSSKLNMPFVTINCDVVVVGSGSGGGVVAGVLAKAGYKVLVLDKGNYYARNNLSLLEGPSMDRMYEGGGLLATDDLGVVVLAGSTVGGGSTINWAASIRTPEHVRKEWCNSLGLELFGSKAYDEALEAVCRRMGVQGECEVEGLNNAVLRKGCQELGYPFNDIPRNAPPDHYCGWCCFGCKDGRKQGTQETWLVDLARSGNGFILPGCKVLKVLVERNLKRGRGKKRATGVVFRCQADQKGSPGWVGVVQSKITVVACGALGTPVLLKRSGLKNPNIGMNLHLHPVVMAWGYFPEKEKEVVHDQESDVAIELENKKSFEGGIMTAMSTVVGNFQTSGYGAVIQTPALHPGMFSVVMPWLSGLDFKMRMCRFSRTAHIFALSRDKGGGEVGEYRDTVRITYGLDKFDEENLRKGVEKMLRILAAAGAEEIGTHHRDGEALNVKRASSHEFERFVKREKGRRLRDGGSTVCSAHQMGSCRMGSKEEESVVNEWGESWEVEDLFVADASVLPTALGVNPMVTVQAIAYCTASSILHLLSRSTPNAGLGLSPL